MRILPRKNSGSSGAYPEFVSLLINHQEIIRSYIIAQLPGSPDVRDILQEVNLVIWEKMNSYEPGTNFGAWSCTIARYKILEYKRTKAQRDGLLVFDQELLENLSQELRDRSPRRYEAKRNALESCLGKLSEKNLKLIRARYASVRGDLGDLSDHTGRSRGSLRVTLFRLRETLRNCINDQIHGEEATS